MCSRGLSGVFGFSLSLLVLRCARQGHASLRDLCFGRLFRCAKQWLRRSSDQLGSLFVLYFVVISISVLLCGTEDLVELSPPPGDTYFG